MKFARAALVAHLRVAGTTRPARRAAIGVVVDERAAARRARRARARRLYLLWAGAWLTTNTLVTRIRSIAEHALTPDADDPLGNTRTTLARWWERLFIAPNRVNYHLEHHLLMTVPHYKLPRLHALLRRARLLARACVERAATPRSCAARAAAA